MRVRFYSKAERERLYPPGVTMTFGGGRYVMHPEAAEVLAYGLVQRDRTTGSYRRVQSAPVDERMIVDEAKAKQRALEH